MRYIFSRKAKAAFTACVWSSAALAHSFTNHAGHVVSGELTALSNGTAVVSGKSYPLKIFPKSEQERMRAIIGAPAPLTPREKSVARHLEEREKRLDALEKAGAVGKDDARTAREAIRRKRDEVLRGRAGE